MIKLENSIQAVDEYISSYQPDYYQNKAVGSARTITQRTETELYRFEAPEGFVIRSQSSEWNEEKLGLLYQDLLENKHGEEIKTLKEIVIYPGDNTSYLGEIYDEKQIMRFKISFSAIPTDFALVFSEDTSTINLYNGDNCNTVASLSRTLSHEYGHLYTFYYMFEDADDLAGTEYAKLREAGVYDLVTSANTGDEYYENHHRYLFEVAAEDYVQVMGGPNTRQTADFPDVRQMLAGREYPDEVTYQSSGNAWPQENMQLPLAAEVPNLQEYFYSFIQQEAPIPVQEKIDFSIGINRQSVGFDLVGGYRTFVSYKLTWDTPYEGAIYTLACYDPEEYMITPIKTVYPGQAASAEIGTVARSSTDYVSWQYDEIDDGTKIFYVVAQLPDGIYYTSEKLDYKFE